MINPKKFSIAVFTVVGAFLLAMLFTFKTDFGGNTIKTDVLGYSTAEIEELKARGILVATDPPAGSGLSPAINTGSTDTTSRLQALINYAYSNRLVLVLPAGTYLISDTLNFVQSAQLADRDDYAQVLWGSTKAARPVIKLAAQSNGFGAGSKKPVLLFKTICHATDIAAGKCNAGPWQSPDNDAANSFRNGLKNIEVVIDSNNPGAVGLSFSGAQDSFIEDIKINVGSGFAGMTDVPGLASVIGNLEIVGGQYGIYAQGARVNGPVITNVKFINQSLGAVFGSVGEGAFALAGFEIVKSSAPAIVMGNRSNMSLLDGSISFTGGNQNLAAIDNTQNQNISMINVFVQNAPKVIKTGTTDFTITGQTANTWYKVKEYYASGEANAKTMIVDGTFVGTQNNVNTGTVAASVPGDIATRHSWGSPDKSPDELFEKSKVAGSGVCDVKRAPFNAVGDGTANDAPAFQAAIDTGSCSTIFLPKSDYYIGSTVTLKNGKTFTGLSMNLTHVYASKSGVTNGRAAANGWTPTFSVTDAATPAVRVAMFTTVDDANASIKLLNMMIRFPTQPEVNDWFTAIHWKAGSKSIIKAVNVKPFDSGVMGSKPKPDIAFTNNAGGKWFGAHGHGLPENKNKVVAGKRRFLIEGTTQPLFLYNFNVEDGMAAHAAGDRSGNNANGWESEAKNVRNLAIIGAKFEDRHGFRFYNAANSMFLGAAARVEFGVNYPDTTQMGSLIATNLEAKRNFSTTLFEERRGTTVTEIRMRDTLLVALYKRGTVDFNAFYIPAPR